jgi:hypothetical protein
MLKKACILLLLTDIIKGSVFFVENTSSKLELVTAVVNVAGSGFFVSKLHEVN